MTAEDWPYVSKIYLEGIATEHATFQTTCPPYTAWDASHTKDCRLVVLDDGVVAGWAALHRVDPRWCYRGVVEVSIYVGEQFRGRGVGFHLLTALCNAADASGYWTLQSTVLQDNEASRRLHAKCGFRLVGQRGRANGIQKIIIHTNKNTTVHVLTHSGIFYLYCIFTLQVIPRIYRTTAREPMGSQGSRAMGSAS